MQGVCVYTMDFVFSHKQITKINNPNTVIEGQEVSYSLWHGFCQFLTAFFVLLSGCHTGIMAQKPKINLQNLR